MHILLIIINVLLHDIASSSDEDSCAGDAELPPPPELGSPPARRPAAPHPRAHPHPLPPQPHHPREKKHVPRDRNEMRERTEIDLSEITHLPACKYLSYALFFFFMQ